MGLGEVNDVNIIPNARTVRCWIISAIDFYEWTLFERNLQNNRDEVRLMIMVFPELAAGAGSIEIPQTDILDAKQSIVPV